MLTRRPLFAFLHSMVAQLRTPSRWSPISDSSMSLSLLDPFARTPSRSSCATRRGMTSSSQNASQKSPKFALKNWIGFRRRYTRFEWVISRKLAYALRIWGYQPENIQPDGFIRMKYILALPTFRKYSVELLRKIVDLDRLKRFELRRQLCKESGVREWSIRLARGELEIPIKEVDRGNKRITHLSRLPPEAQCTLALEDWPFSRRHGLSKRADNNLINLHPSQDNPFAIDYGPSGSVVVVDIDIHAAFYAGIAFYLAKNGDLVTSGDDNGVLPSVYFKKAVKIEYKSQRVIRRAGQLLQLQWFLRLIESEQPDTGCNERGLP